MCGDAPNVTVIPRKRTDLTVKSKQERGDYAVITHPIGHVDSYSLLRQKAQILKGKENLL